MTMRNMFFLAFGFLALESLAAPRAAITDPLEYVYSDTKVAEATLLTEIDVPANGIVDANVLLEGFATNRPVTVEVIPENGHSCPFEKNETSSKMNGQECPFSRGTGANGQECPFSGGTGANGQECPFSGGEWFELKAVPCARNSGKFGFIEMTPGTNPHVAKRAPMSVCDILRPIASENGHSCPFTPSGETAALRWRLRLGERTGVSVLRGGGVSVLRFVVRQEATTVELPLVVRVHKVELPPVGKDSFKYTNWMNFRQIAVRHNLEEWSEAHWAMIEKYVRMAAGARQNMSWFPGLQWLKEENEGRFARLLDIYNRAGIWYLESPHMAGFNGPWGATNFVVGGTKCITTSPEGTEKLTALAQRAQTLIEKYGLKDRWYQHVADEPGDTNAGEYIKTAEIIRRAMPGVKLTDAVGLPDFNGTIDVPCPTVDQFEQKRAAFANARSVWTYVCCVPGGKWLNRFMDQELVKPALLPWASVLFDVDGFLHWGYNQWQKDQDPFLEPYPKTWAGSNNGHTLPPGDTHVVYPGTDGPWASARLEATRSGMEDADLLRMLMRRDHAAATNLIRRIVRGSADYTTDLKAYRTVRRDLLEALARPHATVSVTKRALKTYPYGDPDPVPATDKPYWPYVRCEGCTTRAVTQEWTCVTLESDRLRLTFLPEIGGKLWGAKDLATGRDFIYANDVVKFRDIAMCGPWSSGGIEFNFGLVGHAPTTASPVAWTTRANADGSVSYLCGDTEKICGTTWQVEVILRPGEDFFTMRTQWYNGSPLEEPYYQWMNAAFSVRGEPEFVFPGACRIGHDGKVNSWPKDEEGRAIFTYCGNAFGGAKSYHIVGGDERFYGIWWPKAGFGAWHEADYGEKAGRKIFLWALSRAGGIWEDLLTDSAGQYAELQSGRMFNQPQKSWRSPFKNPSFTPGRTDVFTETWGVARSRPAFDAHLERADQVTRPVTAPKDFDWTSAYGRWLAAEQCAREHDFAGARTNVTAALEKEANFVPALTLSAELKIRQELYAEARTFTARALAVDAYDARANYLDALACEKLGETATALERFGVASYDLAFRPAALCGMARVAYTAGRDGEARRFAARARAANPLSIEAMRLEAATARNLQDFAGAEAAEADLRKAWPLVPVAAPKVAEEKVQWKRDYARAQFLAFAGRTDEAAKMLESCGDPSDDVFHLYRARFRAGAARMSDLRRAQAIRDTWRARLAIAEELVATGNLVGAKGFLVESLAAFPKVNRLEILYADVLQRLGENAACVAFLEGVMILPDEFSHRANEIWQKACRALGDEAKALSYPENLGVGKPFAARAEQSSWKIVRDVNGAPAFSHGGAVESPFFFWQRKLLDEEAGLFASNGVHRYSVAIYPVGFSELYWSPDGKYDFSPIYPELDAIGARNPQAAFLPRLYCFASSWWRHAHSNELIVCANPRAPKHGDWCGRGAQRESYASEVAKREIGDYFRAHVRGLLDRYGDKLMGIHVCNGPWGEYFGWDANFLFPSWGPPMSDCSEPMRRAFSRYLKDKYGTVVKLRAAWKDESVTFETVTVPGYEERMRLSADGWRDPAEGRKVPDYFECHANVLAENCEHYCKIVKEEAGPDFPVVAFFGYTMDEPWGVEADHRNISRIYRSPYVDAFSAPHTYKRRGLGEDGEMRQYLGSAALHGKLFIDEGDDRTHLERLKKPTPEYSYATTPWETDQILWREFGMSVSHGAGIWYMDIAEDNFRDAHIAETIGRARKWSMADLGQRREHLSEVVVISNPESEFYMPYRNNDPSNICTRLYLGQMGAFYRAGAPFDWYLADDLDAVAARTDVKAGVLLDCQYLTDAQVAAIERMKARGVKFLAFHKPGYVSQAALSESRSKRLLAGMRHAPEPDLAPADIRDFYRTAGVHLYTDRDIVLSANKSWVMLHAREAGRYPVRLPRTAARITDVTKERVLAENADTVTLDLKQYETAVLNLK